MKKLLLTLTVVGFAAASAFAGNGSCSGGGCSGDKKESKKDATKTNLTVQF